eukprot:scaffold362_cov176-Amphora_coffeaeformis.AAC.32
MRGILVVLGALFLHDAAVAFLAPTKSSQRVLSRQWERTSADEYAMLQDDDDEEEQVPPGQMRVSEIKAELDLRGISYADCFDKESLADRLVEARATGKANPEILDKFNRQKIEETFKGEKVELKDDEIEAAVANDGTLPGGLTLEQFKKLTSNPEIMTLLQSSKMQEAMKVMMTGGREDVEKKIKDDPELQETIAKLNSIMGSL